MTKPASVLFYAGRFLLLCLFVVAVWLYQLADSWALPYTAPLGIFFLVLYLVLISGLFAPLVCWQFASGKWRARFYALLFACFAAVSLFTVNPTERFLALYPTLEGETVAEAEALIAPFCRDNNAAGLFRQDKIVRLLEQERLESDITPFLEFTYCVENGRLKLVGWYID